MVITHADMCNHAHTQTHASSTLKGLKYSKDSCFDTDKGRCYLLHVGEFQNLWTSKAKTTHAPAKKKPVFSVIFASIQYLCFWFWHLIKKVCSVSDDFSPAIAAYAALSWHSFWFWFTVVILFGLLRSEFVPTSIHVPVQQDQTEKSRNDPNGKAGWGRQSCWSCKYTVDLDLVLMYVAITSPTYRLGKSCLKIH